MMSAASYQRIMGANGRVGVAVIGLKGLGNLHLRHLTELSADADVVALADVHSGWLAERAQMVPDARTYVDFRRVLDRADVDAVVVATPDHWHALMSVLACEAGKDVYVEKPTSRMIGEGRKIVEAAERHGRIVQAGTQQRSSAVFQRVRDIVRGGKLGKVSFVRAWNYSNDAPDGMGHPPDEAPPEELVWDLWLGPSPSVPFNPNRFNRWRNFWDYGGGQMTDWGTHHFDIIHWAMGSDAPLEVSATGGTFTLDDNRDTPDTIVAQYEYPGFVLTYESRHGNAAQLFGRGYGIVFHGSNATLVVDRRGLEIIPEPGSGVEAATFSGKQETHLEHMVNFLDAVRSRRITVSDIESGHRASSATMLANVSFLTGRTIRWDAENERIVDDADASRRLNAVYRDPWSI